MVYFTKKEKKEKERKDGGRDEMGEGPVVHVYAGTHAVLAVNTYLPDIDTLL